MVEETEKINLEDDRIFYGIMDIIVVMLINISWLMQKVKNKMFTSCLNLVKNFFLNCQIVAQELLPVTKLTFLGTLAI